MWHDIVVMTGVISFVDNLVDNLLDLLFPKRCVNCAAVGGFVCEECFRQVKYCEVQVCPQCTEPSIGGFTHPLCRRRLGAERTLCVFKFEGPIKESISALKYGGVRALAGFMADLAVAAFTEASVSFGTDSLILPVPLHPVKKLERGFNQTEILAKAFGQRLSLEVWPDLLVKKKDNPSQTKLDREQRAANVRDAFGVNERDSRPDLLKGRDVVIVDDVFTSGATLRECAKVVKGGGARYVYLLALAKD